LSGRVPAPELPPGPRSALVIATNTYADETLSQLRAPARDAADLADVLADPGVGAFTVTLLLDRTAHEIRLGVEDFLANRGHDDLLVLYLSCHGIRDKRGRLYFAATDSRKTHLGATGVESSWLLDQLDECRARRQVVILDCCFSGAFAVGAKGEPEIDLQRHLLSQGRGRAVLTASRAGEYSFEGEVLAGALPAGSVFTSGMVEGLRSGAADTDQDGFVSVEDAYDYAFAYVRERGVAQTPQRWVYGAEGKIWLARNPTGATIKPVPLPEALRAALDNPHPEVRLGVVTTLGIWLTEGAGRAQTAQRELQDIAETEIPRVAGAARALLSAGTIDEAAAPAMPTPAPAPEHLLEAARAEAKEIVEAAQREYDEIIVHAELLRTRADQDMAIARAAADQASERLVEAERVLADRQTDAARILSEAEHERDRERLKVVADLDARREATEREIGTRRTQLAQDRLALKAQAERIINDARAQAHRLLSEASEARRTVQIRVVIDPRSLPEPDLGLVSRGYDRVEVDRYLTGLRSFAGNLSGMEPPSPPAFATERRGYSREQVDYYIAIVRHLISRSLHDRAALRVETATMFVNMARRSQILVDRLIGHLDRLERGEQDPDRLSELFQLDHLATRMRRNDENLLVLAGADSTRIQREPAAFMDVLRAAQSEVEHYTRIEFGVIDQDIEIAAHAVNDLVHLVAELFDNATAFSPPDTKVNIEARRRGDRAVLQVEDRGIGMSPDQYSELNERLSAPPPLIGTTVTRMIGLAVVARLAARLGLAVELRPSATRGTVAEVRLPAGVLAWRYPGRAGAEPSANQRPRRPPSQG